VVIFGDPISGACRQVTPGESELVIFLGGAEVEREEREKFYDAGVPVFPTPERGVKALAQFFRFAPPKAPAITASGVIPGGYPHPRGLELIPAFEAAVMMSKAGIPAASAPLAITADEAVTLAESFGYPVALKIASPDFPHKTDVGGVYLNLRDEAMVRAAYQAIKDSARFFDREAKIDGVTVSPMAKPGALEVILGILTDPQYGPVLMFGLGGIQTEIYRDVAFCLLPAEDEELLALMKKIKGYPLLAGFRGRPKLDTDALLEAMKVLARYAFKHPELDQIELNPLLLYPKGLFAVDVRIFSRV
jgi:acetyltransferase